MLCFQSHNVWFINKEALSVCFTSQLKRRGGKLCRVSWTSVMRSRSARRWRTPCRNLEVRNGWTLNSNSRRCSFISLCVLLLPWLQGLTSWWTMPVPLTWQERWTHPWRRWTSCWASIWEEPISREFTPSYDPFYSCCIIIIIRLWHVILNLSLCNV